MKVLMLGNYPSKESGRMTGGVTTHMVSLTNNLSQLDDIELHIVTIGKGEGVVEEGLKTIHSIRKLGIPFDDTFFHVKPLTQRIHEIKPDVVHCQGTFSPYSLAALNVAAQYPTAITVHGIISLEVKFIWSSWKFPQRIYYPRIEKKALRGIRNIIAVSPYVKKMIESMTDSRIEIIPNGIDEDFFDIPISEDKGRLLFVGAISERKGIHNLVDAVEIVKRQISRTELHLVGPIASKSYFDKIMKDIELKNLKENIIYRGEIPRFSLLNEYKSCAIFVLPSKEESFGITILEAMAAGKPIVATNVGAASWLVNNGLNGFVTDPEDNRDLARKILVLMHNADMRRLMGEKGREKAKDFIWKNIAKQTFRYYQQITGKR